MFFETEMKKELLGFHQSHGYGGEIGDSECLGSFLGDFPVRGHAYRGIRPSV